MENQSDIRNIENFTPEISENWENLNLTKNKSSNIFVRVAIYILVGMFSFLMFIYLTLPYTVIKEVVVSQVNSNFKQMGVPVSLSIGSLEPYWFTGVEIKDMNIVNISEPAAKISFNQIKVRLQLLPLLIGSVSVAADAIQSKGQLEIQGSLSLFGILSGRTAPKSVNVVLRNFSLDSFIQQGLTILKHSKEPAMMLLLPLVSKTSAGGSLSGEVALDNPDVSSLTKAKGKVDLQFKDFFLHIDDDTLKIPKQIFTSSKVNLRYSDGIVGILEGTELIANDLGFNVNGDVRLSDNASPQARLNLTVNMKPVVEKNIGFLVRTALGCGSKQPVNDQLVVKLTGSIPGMKCE